MSYFFTTKPKKMPNIFSCPTPFSCKILYVPAYFTITSAKENFPSVTAKSSCFASLKQSSISGENTPHSPSRIMRAASSTANGSLYTRLLTSASYTSTTDTICAQIGISSPFNLSGYPFPSWRSWWYLQIS